MRFENSVSFASFWIKARKNPKISCEFDFSTTNIKTKHLKHFIGTLSSLRNIFSNMF